MKVLLAGATGVVGRPLVARLLEAGHEVVGITRSSERARTLASAGAQAVTTDLLDGGSLRKVVDDASPDVVVDQTTDLPQRAGYTRFGMQRFYRGQLRLEQTGKPALLQAALAAGVTRYVMQSIGFIYAPDGSGPKGEHDPVFRDAPPPWREVLPPLLSLEEQVTCSPALHGIVLRYGYFYGPGTYFWPGGQFHEQVLHRRFPIVGNGMGTWSFIHVDDAAAATVSALTARDAGIFNVVDDEPAPLRVWLPFYASLIGGKPPLTVPAVLAKAVSGPLPVHWATTMPGVANERAKGSLGWQPRRPTWRDGFVELRSDP